MLLISTGLQAQFSGGDGALESPYKISTLADLKELSENSNYWNAYFVLTQNIDASDTQTWNSGAGFSPIGNNQGVLAFRGNFDGQGYQVSNLYIKRPTQQYIGFFGALSGAKVKNLGLTNLTIEGVLSVGGLAGSSTSSTISHCYTTGAISSTDRGAATGGVIGEFYGGTVKESYSLCTVNGGYAGGFIGITNGNIVDCWAGGMVQGITMAGGFVGMNFLTIKRSYSWGKVTIAASPSTIGGFVGFNQNTIEDSFYDQELSQHRQNVKDWQNLLFSNL